MGDNEVTHEVSFFLTSTELYIQFRKWTKLLSVKSQLFILSIKTKGFCPVDLYERSYTSWLWLKRDLLSSIAELLYHVALDCTGVAYFVSTSCVNVWLGQAVSGSCSYCVQCMRWSSRVTCQWAPCCRPLWRGFCCLWPLTVAPRPSVTSMWQTSLT